MIPMPLRNTMEETIACTSSRFLKLACAVHYLEVEIGEVAKIVSGGTPSTSNPAYWSGDITWITPKDLGKPRSIDISSSERTITEEGVGGSSARMLPAGTVLLSSRAPIGHLGIAEVSLCTNQGFKNLICSGNLENRYAFHMLRGSIPEIRAKGRGNTFEEITSGMVSKLTIPLPPRAIQEAISRFLDILYLQLAGYNQSRPILPPPLDRYGHEIQRLRNLLGKLDVMTRIRKESIADTESLIHAARSAIFSSIRPIGKIVEIAESGLGVNVESCNPKREWPNQEFEYIDISSVESGTGAITMPKKCLGFEAPSRARRIVRAGDVILSTVRPYLRSFAIIPQSLDGQICSTGFAVFRLNSKIEARFLLHQFFSEYFISQCRDIMRGAHYPAINIKQLLQCKLMIPFLEDQHKIVNYLESMQHRITKLVEAQSHMEMDLEEFQASILDDLYNSLPESS